MREFCYCEFYLNKSQQTGIAYNSSCYRSAESQARWQQLSVCEKHWAVHDESSTCEEWVISSITAKLLEAAALLHVTAINQQQQKRLTNKTKHVQAYQTSKTSDLASQEVS